MKSLKSELIASNGTSRPVAVARGGGGGGGCKACYKWTQPVNKTCMYGEAHTARCRVCMKLRKPRERCGRGTPLPPSMGAALPNWLVWCINDKNIELFSYYSVPCI